jgi:hypothetical protein
VLPYTSAGGPPEAPLLVPPVPPSTSIWIPPPAPPLPVVIAVPLLEADALSPDVDPDEEVELVKIVRAGVA